MANFASEAIGHQKCVAQCYLKMNAKLNIKHFIRNYIACPLHRVPDDNIK
jgi:hypothetical protein